MDGKVRRRGLIAGAAALVAGLAVARTADRVAAITGGSTGGFLVIGGNFNMGNTPNTANQATDLVGTVNGDTMYYGSNAGVSFSSGGFTFVPAAFDGVADNGWAVVGNSQNQYGVVGRSSGAGTGVFGGSVSGSGVNGQSLGAGNGVYGQSATGYGVLGFTSSGAASISGISTNINIPAFNGGNSVAGGVAAVFSGLVYVNGRLVVTDPSYKSGLLKHPDGSSRLVYCVESPESWIEDFGTGTLTNGKADMKFDADFAAVTDTSKALVYVTPNDGVGALRTARHSPSGFAVEEIGGASNGSFVWRAVAKPKTDKKTSRLEKFVPPQTKLPSVADLPKMPGANVGPKPRS